MKTWIFWNEHIHRQFKKLDPDCRGTHLDYAPSPISSAYLAFCKEIHENHSDATDEAVRCFAETEEFGDLSPEVRFCIACRLHTAETLLFALMTPKEGYQRKTFIPSPEKGTKHSEIWRWMLIDLWDFWGESEYFLSLEKDIRSGWFESGSIWRDKRK